MNKINILLAMLLLSLTITVSAQSSVVNKINGVTLTADSEGTLVPESMNDQFLKGVYCGSPKSLKNEQIVIMDARDNEAYTLAMLDVGDDTYLVTYKPEGGVIDGVLLLCRDDIFLVDNVRYPKNKVEARFPEITIEDNKVTVKRNFSTIIDGYDIDIDAISKEGGKYTTEDGSVIITYVVDQSGKITEDGVKMQSQLLKFLYAPVPGGDGHIEKMVDKSPGKCETLGPGLELLSCYAIPIKNENPNKLESIFVMNRTDFGNNLFSRAVALGGLTSPNEWLQRLIYRNPQLWLSWLNDNQESLCMESVMQTLDSDNEFKQWLQGEVKSLKDKKLRKAWQQKLK